MTDSENPPSGGPDNSVVTADGSFAEGWEKNYPEEDRATLGRFKRFDDFVTSHMSLRRMSDKDPDKLVEVPDENSSDEVKAEFHRRRGVPEKVEDYKYERSKELSDNIDVDDEKVAAFAGIAKKHNLTQEQFVGIANDYLALIDKDISTFDLVQEDKKQKEFEAAEAALKKEMGKSYEERVARANVLLRQYKGQEMVAELGLENNPAMTRFLDAIAEDMSEDRIKGLTSVTTPTPSAVQDKINELKEHPAYMDAAHPQHQQILDDLTEQYKKKSA